MREPHSIMTGGNVKNKHQTKYQGELEAERNINAFLKNNNIPQISYRGGKVLFSENKEKGLGL